MSSTDDMAKEAHEHMDALMEEIASNSEAEQKRALANWLEREVNMPSEVAKREAAKLLASKRKWPTLREILNGRGR